MSQQDSISEVLSPRDDFSLVAEDSCCIKTDWHIVLSQPGWANCSLGRYLNGVWRGSASQNGGNQLMKGRCCTPPQEYQDETLVCQTVDWTTSLSRSVKWLQCVFSVNVPCTKWLRFVQHQHGFNILFPDLETTPGLPVRTAIFFKGFTFQTMFRCTTLSKLRAAGLTTTKKPLCIAMSKTWRFQWVAKAGASAKTGPTWWVCTKEPVTSCTVSKPSDAAGCRLQVSRHYTAYILVYPFPLQ